MERGWAVDSGDAAVGSRPVGKVEWSIKMGESSTGVECWCHHNTVGKLG